MIAGLSAHFIPIHVDGKKVVDPLRVPRRLHTVFQQHELPADMETFTVSGRMKITDVIAAAKLASSRNEARCLIAGDGVALDGRKVGDPFEVVTSAAGGLCSPMY
jgi:tyrosyl-tRNA synthetase